MFQKIIGIIGALAVVGVIVMVALSPRAPGFFPDVLDFLKTRQAEPVMETALPSGSTTEDLPVVDSLSIETQSDTLIQN